MAYIDDPNQQNNQNQMDVFGNQSQTQPQENNQQQEVNVSGSSLAPTTNQPPTQQSPQQRQSQPKGSGMFSDIRKYISANKGAGQQIGQAATQKFTNQASNVGQQIQQQKDKLQQQVQQNEARRQQAQQFATQQIQQAGQVQQPTQQPVQNNVQTSAPTQQQFVTPTEQESQRFQNLLGGKERFDVAQQMDLGKQSMEAKNLQNLAQNVDRGSGRYDLLRQTFGDKRYTRGQQSLDAMLLAGDEQARKNLGQTIRQSSQQLGQDLSQAQRYGREQVGSLQQAQKQFQEQLGTQLQDAFTGVKTGVEERAKQYNVGMQELAKNLSESLKRGNIYEEDLASLGEEGQNYLKSLADQYTAMGTERMGDLSKYLTARNLLGDTVQGQDERMFSDTDLSRIATEQQLARQRALESLKGTKEAERTFLVQDPTQVGGRLDVGKYTGKDIGLLGGEAEGSFQSAREAALKDIQNRIASEATGSESDYYWRRGVHTGYGYQPGERNAREFARQAMENYGQFDTKQLEALYGGEKGILSEMLTDSGSGVQNVDLGKLDTLRSEFQGMRDVAQDVYNPDTRRYETRYSPDATEEQIQRYNDLKRGLSNIDQEGAKSFLDSLRARQQAVQALRSGRFKLGSRGGNEG